MPDASLAKIVNLAASAPPELRLAALRILGQVGSAKDKAVVQVLTATLDDADPELRRAAIEAIGLLKMEEALPRLDPFIRNGGAELEGAVHAASQLGAKGTRLVAKIMDDALPHLRSRIAGELAKSGTGNALVVTAHALLDNDPKVVEAAARSLAMEVPSFSSGQKSTLAKSLIEELQKKEGHPPHVEAALMRVLGPLHDDRAEGVLWDRLAANQPKAVKVAALQALGVQAKPPTDARLQRLLACAEDADFQVVAGALMLLKDVAVGKKNQKPWLKLLGAPDVATRRFVLDKLKGLATKEWAETLVGLMAHPDRQLREEVLNELGSFAIGTDALLERLLESEQPDPAWQLARALSPKLKKLTDAQRDKIFGQACKWQEAEDRRAGPLWFLLRELDARGLRDSIEERAAALRKKKNYEAALEYYRLLAQDPAVGEETRFELAATSLKLSQKDVAEGARQADPALNQFARLLQNASFDLFERVKKAKWLEAEDLFYLGFHFIEQTHRAREFGKQVLELVVEKTPKSELGKTAKRKLKS